MTQYDDGNEARTITTQELVAVNHAVAWKRALDRQLARAHTDFEHAKRIWPAADVALYRAAAAVIESRAKAKAVLASTKPTTAAQRSRASIVLEVLRTSHHSRKVQEISHIVGCTRAEAFNTVASLHRTGKIVRDGRYSGLWKLA